MNHDIHKRTLAFTVILPLVLAACLNGGSEQAEKDAANDTAAPTPAPTGTPQGGTQTTPAATILRIDATAGGLGAKPEDPRNQYTYLNLETGLLSLTDAEAAASTAWHIAFKRSNIKLNGGVSGPGGVKGALADSQTEFYTANGDPIASVFLNATADNEKLGFDTVTGVDGLTFSTDRTIPAITGDGGPNSWWSYNPAAFTVTAAPDNWWLVRSAGGDSYAKIHVTDIVQASRDITLELFIQGADESVFSGTATRWTANIGIGGGTQCYDFDGRSAVACTGGDWDIKVEVSGNGRAWNLWTNGGAFGVIAAANIAGYVSGTLTAAGQNIAALYMVDKAGGVFTEQSWYAYSLQNDNKLYPNYRVYAIDAGAAKYKLQILSYYNEAGTSAMYNVRYAPLP